MFQEAAYKLAGGACSIFLTCALTFAHAAVSVDSVQDTDIHVAVSLDRAANATSVTPDVELLNMVHALAPGRLETLTSAQVDILSNRMSVSVPEVFAAIGVNNWREEVAGLEVTDINDDLTDPATNIVYLPPVSVKSRLGTLHIGISYSSTLRDCLADLCNAPESFPDEASLNVGLQSLQSWADVFETAVYYEKAVGGTESGLRLGVGAKYVSTDEEAYNFEGAGEVYKSYALGMNVAYRGLTVEGTVKNASNVNDNTVDATDGYLAFDAGITFETGGWGFMLAYGAGNEAALDATVGPVDPAFYRETKSAQAGVSYVFDHGVTLGAAAQIMQADILDFDRPGSNAEAAVLIESAIRF